MPAEISELDAQNEPDQREPRTFPKVRPGSAEHAHELEVERC